MKQHLLYIVISADQKKVRVWHIDGRLAAQLRKEAKGTFYGCGRKRIKLLRGHHEDLASLWRERYRIDYQFLQAVALVVDNRISRMKGTIRRKPGGREQERKFTRRLGTPDS